MSCTRTETPFTPQFTAIDKFEMLVVTFCSFGVYFSYFYIIVAWFDLMNERTQGNVWERRTLLRCVFQLDVFVNIFMGLWLYRGEWHGYIWINFRKLCCFLCYFRFLEMNHFRGDIEAEAVHGIMIVMVVLHISVVWGTVKRKYNWACVSMKRIGILFCNRLCWLFNV